MRKEYVRTVKVFLQLCNVPFIHEYAQTYQKGDMFCVLELHNCRVFKYPVNSIFRVEEDYMNELQAHPEEKPDHIAVPGHGECKPDIVPVTWMDIDNSVKHEIFETVAVELERRRNAAKKKAG
jgi:hypothetical protein